MTAHDDDPGLDDALKAAKHRTGAMAERLDQIEAVLQGDAAARQSLQNAEPLAGPTLSDYDQIVAASQAYLRSIGRVDDDLEDVLAADELALLRKDGLRLRWTTRDRWAVGLAAVLAGTASWFADAIDAGMVEALKDLKEHDGKVGGWLREMEESSKGLSIDYTGKGAGGRRHRGTSAGHDIGRPVEAIRQIMDGEYRGTDFSLMAGIQPMRRHGTPGGTPFESHDLGAALTQWVMHLISDVVTSTSLPLPGWTKLYELAPTADVADVFLDLYAPNDWSVPGLNLRTVAVGKSIPVLVTEVAVRSSLAWDAYQQAGSVKLGQQERVKRDEMLLAAHSTTTIVMGAQIAREGGVLGLRNVNPQLVARVAHLGVRFYAEHQQRQDLAPADWDTLARAEAKRNPDLFGAWLNESEES